MRARRGYTLIEILLVLAVVAVIAAIAWPVMLRFVGDRVIQDAGQQVLSELDRTRFRAIDSGVPYQFLIEPNGRHFIAIPAKMRSIAAGGNAASVPVAAPAAYSGQLPEELAFGSGLIGVLSTTPSMMAAGPTINSQMLANLENGGALGRVQWSQPILYLPDGTAMDASFRILDKEGRSIEFFVRGLTGMARAGPVRRESAR